MQDLIAHLISTTSDQIMLIQQFQQRMKQHCILLLLCLYSLTPLTSEANTANPSVSRNYFMASGKNMVTPSNINTMRFQTYYYTSNFNRNMQTISEIYYSTAEIQARTANPNFPGTGPSTATAKKFIWYEIDAVNSSSTHLTTGIRGYFEQPYLRYFSYFFLIVLNNNPFMGKYIVIEELTFSPTSNTTYQINYPTAYQAGHTVTLTPFIKQLKTIYSESDLKSYNNSLTFVNLKWNHASASKLVSADIDLPNYVVVEANYSITYLVMVTDESALSSSLKKYQFIADYFLSLAGDPSTSKALPQNPLVSDSNVFFGIAGYNYYNDNEDSLNLRISYTSNQLNVRFTGELGGLTIGGGFIINGPTKPQQKYSYAYAFFPYYECPNYYFVYNQTTNECYDGCLQPNQYYDQALSLCQPCPLPCLTCYNSRECRTCDAAAFRQFSNFSCVPFDGYFESNATAATPCSANCVLCAGTATNCTKCAEVGQVLRNGSCVNCFDVVEGCSDCNATQCFACNASYAFVNETLCALPCASAFCLRCSNANTSLCFECAVGYSLANGLCTLNAVVKAVVCGDLVIDVGEECDDGNLIDRDGCDSHCKVEQFYQCYSNTTALGQSFTNYCAFTAPIDFAFISIEKLSYSNTLRILIAVTHYRERFWETRSTLSNFVVESPIPYRNMAVAFLSRASDSSVKVGEKLSAPQAKLSPTLVSGHPPSAVVAVSFEYLQPIHGQRAVLSLNFSQSNDYSLTQIPVTALPFDAVPDNNHFAALYSDETYAQQRTLSHFLLFVAVASVAVTALTFFVGSKRVSTEMLTVVQVAYASLLTAPKLSPLFVAVTSLAAANNGYNLMYTSQLRPFEDTLVGDRAKGAQLYSQFVYNFNAGTLFVVLPLVAGLALFIASRVRDADQEGAKRMRRMYRLALGEFVFAGLVFGGCAVGVAAVLQVQCGMREMASGAGMLSALVTAVLLVLYAAYGFVRAKGVFLFEEYSAALLSEDAALAFHLVHFYLGLCTGALLCALSAFAWVNCAAAVLPLSLYFVTVARPLFRKQMDRVRTQLNLLTMVLLQAPFLYVNLRDGEAFYGTNDAVLLVPVTVAILLFVNFAVNLSFVVYEIIKKVRDSINEREKQQKRQNEQSKNEYSMVPEQIQQFKKPMLVNSFIEYSSGQYKQFYEMNLLKSRQFSPKSIIGELKQSKFQSIRKQVEQRGTNNLQP